MVHLMSAGRLRYLGPGEKGPKTPAFRLRFAGGGELVLTEAGKKKRAGVWLLHARGGSRRSSPTSGRRRTGSTRRGSAGSSRRDSRRLHSLLRDQRAIAGIGRAWANEILHAARALAVRALDAAVARTRSSGSRPRSRTELARGLELGERGANDAKTYRVHNRLGEPCPRCGTPIAPGRLRGAHDLLLPACQTGGRRAQGPAAVAAPAMSAARG